MLHGRYCCHDAITPCSAPKHATWLILLLCISYLPYSGNSKYDQRAKRLFDPKLLQSLATTTHPIPKVATLAAPCNAPRGWHATWSLLRFPLATSTAPCSAPRGWHATWSLLKFPLNNLVYGISIKSHVYLVYIFIELCLQLYIYLRFYIYIYTYILVYIIRRYPKLGVWKDPCTLTILQSLTCISCIK